ncbi:hypothetical protein OG361_33800 [Streptomyces sp. NBC_00090]|uniref:hypothetical protein n=1 Tax=Streptomyces sp. NBC_00090 TaxID=2903619 RepID=UPI0032517E1B
MQQRIRHAETPPTDRPAHPGPGRFRAAWRAAHEPVPGVSRRIRLVAYAVPFTVLPASLWRLPAAFDAGIGIGERLYVVFLSVFSEAVAFTAMGLIARWGEVVPGWVPILRGRRIPPAAVLVPAAPGGVLSIRPGSRRLAPRLAALSSLAMVPRSPSGTGGAPTAMTPSSALRSTAPDAAP